jgi:hypothetical protein
MAGDKVRSNLVSDYPVFLKGRYKNGRYELRDVGRVFTGSSVGDALRRAADFYDGAEAVSSQMRSELIAAGVLRADGHVPETDTPS